MTVSSAYVPNISDGDGVSTVFPVTFRFGKAADVRCTIYAVDGTPRIPTFNVTGTGDPGGTVTITSAPPLVGEKVVRERVTELRQPTNYEAGDFPSAAHEDSADRLVMMAQERDAIAGRTLRFGPLTAPIDAIAPVAVGQTLIRTATGFGPGPTADEVSDAQGYAQSAAASAASALAKENSMLRARGAWAAAMFYTPSDQFTFGGQVYLTLSAHFSTTVAADLSAGRIMVWVEKGASGSGSGDMNNADNLSGLTDKPLAYTTIGGKAVGKVDLLPFSLIDPATVITDVEGLAGNKVANAIPVAKAVTDYVDAALAGVGGAPGAQFNYEDSIAGGTISSGAYASLPLNATKKAGLGITRAGNDLTFANAGTYFAEGFITFRNTSSGGRSTGARLRNTTTNETEVVAMGQQSTQLSGGTLHIAGEFTVAAGNVLQLQAISNGGLVTNGDDIDATTGEINVYTVLKFWRVS